LAVDGDIQCVATSNEITLSRDANNSISLNNQPMGLQLIGDYKASPSDELWIGTFRLFGNSI